MTHSILLTIKLASFDDVQELRKRILEDDEDSWLTPYKLRKTPKGEFYPDIQPSSGFPPFICFPKREERDEDDGTYHVIVESGSHCDFSDTQESFWMWVFWFNFLQEVESYGIDFTYAIGTDGDRDTHNMNTALKEIVTGSELEKFIRTRR